MDEIKELRRYTESARAKRRNRPAMFPVNDVSLLSPFSLLSSRFLRTLWDTTFRSYWSIHQWLELSWSRGWIWRARGNNLEIRSVSTNEVARDDDPACPSRSQTIDIAITLSLRYKDFKLAMPRASLRPFGSGPCNMDMKTACIRCARLRGIAHLPQRRCYLLPSEYTCETEERVRDALLAAATLSSTLSYTR